MTTAKKKRMIGLAVGVSALFLIVAISAVAGRGFRHWRGDEAFARKMIESRVEDVMDDINADASQRAEIMALTDELLSEAMKMRSTHREGEAIVLTELKKDRPDAEALHSMIDAKLDRIEGFAHGTLDRALKVYDTLRPDQREILLEKVEEHFKDRKEHVRRHHAR